MILVYADSETGRSGQIELDEQRSSVLIGRGINDIIEGSAVGLSGCKLRITGGSDTSGFAMRSGMPGTIKKKVFARGASGISHKATARGNTIAADTRQVNAVIVEHDGSLDKIFTRDDKSDVQQGK